MFGLLCLTLGIAFSSAIVPIVSMELWVLGVMASAPTMHWLAIGCVVALGQVSGKLLYYFAARGSVKLPKLLHNQLHRQRPPSARRERWRALTKRIRVHVEKAKERCHRHPHWMAGTYGVSAIVGLPPIMATTVLAGLVRMRLSTFLVTGLIGRFVRFSALAAAPAVFVSWTHF